MEDIREKYRQLTGKEPGRIVVVDGELEESIDQFISEHGGSKIGMEGITQEEFIDILRTPEGYEIHGAELQKSNGRVHKIYFEEKQVQEGYLGDSLRALGVGDSLILHLSGRNERDIKEKLGTYLHKLDSETTSRTQGHSEDVQVQFQVLNQYGIHARPAAMIVKYCNDFDDDIEIELDGNRVSAKSIMGLMTIEAIKGKKPVICINGPNSKEIISGLEELFKSGFGEN